ncbi:DUF3189 family protein [Clostridium formicaceticum]|uniref:ABC transporter n=1 Tax=Clostridium formicaceticum TaxID=1497 RepID=A0AAC9RPN1_9CLOT|nr:DUF3189 family protein [Clostridium formicaceticum]AOY78076.1 ABC transporter [Clostridium formicaceticum]ARE88718.1 hypothetical protein CLFO_31240 [Clostridium formicaceticum]
MIYIYNCYAGTHSSSLASAIHLNKLPLNRVPTREEILDTDYFNRLKFKDMGRIIFRGIDEEGNKVFSVGRGTSRVLIPCLKNLITILHNECGMHEKIIFSNMSPTVTLPMTIGGFLSRGLGMDFVGVPLLVLGSQQAHKHVIEVVNHTKAAAKNLNESVLILSNETLGKH